MAELDDNDPRVVKAVTELSKYLAHFCGRPFSTQTVYDIQDTVQSCSAKFKADHGHELPRLVALVLPTSQQVTLYRADLSSEIIRQKIIYLLRDYQRLRIPVSTHELALAIKQCWPQYEPPIEDARRDPKLKLLLQ